MSMYEKQVKGIYHYNPKEEFSLSDAVFCVKLRYNHDGLYYLNDADSGELDEFMEHKNTPPKPMPKRKKPNNMEEDGRHVEYVQSHLDYADLTEQGQGFPMTLINAWSFNMNLTYLCCTYI